MNQFRKFINLFEDDEEDLLESLEEIESETEKIDPIELSDAVESLVRTKHLTYMEAVLEYCAENYVDPRDLTQSFTPQLKSRIIVDLQNEGYVKKPENLESFFA